MKAVVVYESHWGNTAAVARAVAEGIGPGTPALTTTEATSAAVADADLIVAGAPLLGFALPTEGMLQNMGTSAARDPIPPDLAHPPLRTWLDGLPQGSGCVAAFETRIWWSPGSAAKAILKKSVPPNQASPASTGRPHHGNGWPVRSSWVYRRSPMQDRSILIIGAGFAGLAAGIYAQMNGYRTQICEMHSLPGGLCTAWQRKGYTIDGCIHWLVGSSPRSSFHRYWQEVGGAQGREFINLDEYMRYEGADGRTVILYSDVNRLEQHLLAFSPQDAAATRELIQGIRLALAFDQPAPADPPLTRLWKGLKLGLLLVTRGREMQRWMQMTADEFTARFQDPVLRGALREMWIPEFAMFFMLFTFAYLHKKDAGYPIGGSLPMARALERRYLDLGGTIHYHSRVEKILVAGDRAVGVRLADGSERYADRIISAADGYTTIFKMLEGRYVDAATHEPYEKWPVFSPLLYVGIGVNRTFDDEPKTVSGLSFPLRQPTEIADAVRERLSVRIFNQDPTLAPPGKTVLVVMLSSSYAYWKELAQDRATYEEKKDQVARTIVALLEQRFPGISGQMEMVDVATPLTFERYTGNWQGSFEGWLLTPHNASTMMRPMRQTLPGLQRFYMCGQWVEPGGGLPTSVMSGRRLIQALCKEDRRKFVTTG